MRPIEAVKADYLAGLGTLKNLAAKYNVPLRTVAQHASDQSWKSLKDNHLAVIARKSAAEAIKSAKNAGTALGKQAAAFLQRSIDETHEYLDRAKQLRDDDMIDPVGFRHVVSSWDTILQNGRKAFGMDQENGSRHPTVMVQTIQAIQVATNPSPPDTPSQVTSESGESD